MTIKTQIKEIKEDLLEVYKYENEDVTIFIFIKNIFYDKNLKHIYVLFKEETFEKDNKMFFNIRKLKIKTFRKLIKNFN